MANTDDFFKLITEHQIKRSALDEDYKVKRQKLERFKGSRGYDEDLASLKKEYKEQTESLASSDASALKQITDRMHKVNASRTVPTPTTDELGLLQMLRMRDPRNITSGELTKISNALQSDVALDALRDFAKEHHIIYHQEQKRDTAPSIASVDEKIDFLFSETCHLFNDSAQPAARLWAERQAANHGNAFDPDDLPRRPQFKEKREAFGMSQEALAAFCEAVD